MALTLIVVFIALMLVIIYAVWVDIRLTRDEHLLVGSGIKLKRRKDDPNHPMRRFND